MGTTIDTFGDTDVEDVQTRELVECYISVSVPNGSGSLIVRSKPADPNVTLFVERLKAISDELEESFGERLNRDAVLWIKEATFDKFVQIAEGLFADGITLSRIVVLFMFAVKVVFNAFSLSMTGLAGDVISFVVKFVMIKGIYAWIQSRGGWGAVLLSWTPASTVNGLLVFSCVLAMVFWLVYRKS